MDKTASGFEKCQQLIKMTVTFRDETVMNYWVIKGSISVWSYVSDIQQFSFHEYQSVDEGDEHNGMFHGGCALVVSHFIPIDTIKDVAQSPDYLFAGEGVLYIWRHEDDSDNFVVADESWVENLV